MLFASALFHQNQTDCSLYCWLLSFIVPLLWILGCMTRRRSGSDQFLGIRRKRMQFKISTSSSCREWEVRLYILKEKASSSFFFLACSFPVLIESIKWKDSRFKCAFFFLLQIYFIMTILLDSLHHRVSVQDLIPKKCRERDSYFSHYQLFLR